MSMQPAELEQRAERAVRRGELLAAIEQFEAYLAQQPDDDRVRQRMESVRALLHPSELINRRRSEPEEPPEGAAEMSDAEIAEMHASSGHFDEAVAAYERAAQANPENELLRERLEELRRLIDDTGARADLGRGEKLGAAPMPAQGGARSARASQVSFAPLPRTAPPARLPADPVQMLEALLERVRGHRRR
jgi:tetratricopeptide (TPR) repeat protein